MSTATCKGPLITADASAAYAVITHHPNGIEGRLLVHSWHPTENDADAASVRLAMEFSETIDGKNVIPASMAGLAIVAEDELLELVPGHLGDPRRGPHPAPLTPLRITREKAHFTTYYSVGIRGS